MLSKLLAYSVGFITSCDSDSECGQLVSRAVSQPHKKKFSDLTNMTDTTSSKFIIIKLEWLFNKAILLCSCS